ncbi:MAG: ECF transporter S component [Oscillospiraceae bacterium]|nr:ECF transporter S component [Oscillospiraceae bacterium]MBP3520995.1 ECF transporter S component [Oscillospiraceae bacterium]
MGSTRYNTRKLALLALFTAIVAVLQMLGVAIRFGTFAVSMVGVPVILGAALMGPLAGAWLGLVFGIAVLVSGDAALFLTWDPAATVIIVLLKGTLAGLAAGGVYQLLEKRNTFLAVLAAAVAYPLVNTGVFFLGCMVFFLEDCIQFAANLGVTGSGPVIVMSVFIGFNFFFELGLDLVLSGIVERLVKIGKTVLKRA